MVGLRTVSGLCHLANVLQRAYSEAQGLLEVESSAMLVLVDSNRLLSCPMAMSFCPFPHVSVTTVQSGDGSGLDAAESSGYRGDSKERQAIGFSRRLLGVRKGKKH